LNTKYNYVFPPLCICISTKSDYEFHNLDVLLVGQCIKNDAYTNDGKVVVDSVNLSSAPEDITFKDMLCLIKSTEYSVGITYVQSTTPGQLEEPIYLRKGEINELLVPTVDPYEECPEIVA
jgi:hypothetical protein